MHDYVLPPKPVRSTSTNFKNYNPLKTKRVPPKSKSSTDTSLCQMQEKMQKNLEEAKKISGQAQNMKAALAPALYMFSIEDCILEARKQLLNIDNDSDKHGEHSLECPRHGIVRWKRKGQTSSFLGPDLARMAPDLLFIDLEDDWLCFFFISTPFLLLFFSNRFLFKSHLKFLHQKRTK